EPFGPVAVMLRFQEMDDVLSRANKLPYGLASYAFTKNAQTATRVADALESGMVTINHFVIALPETPFGGLKESDFGHGGGVERVQACLHAHSVSHLSGRPRGRRALGGPGRTAHVLARGPHLPRQRLAAAREPATRSGPCGGSACHARVAPGADGGSRTRT